MAANNSGSKKGSAYPPWLVERMRQRRATRKRPAGLADGHWLGDLVPLSDAERDLVEQSRIGELCKLGTECPDASKRENTVRADIIRFLVLGGDEKHPVHERGVWLKGAWIDGRLDLEGVSSVVSLALWKCQLDGLLRATDAKLPGLRLEGTRLRALDADRVTVHGSVFLNNGFWASEEVRFVGAEIGGNLDCDAGKFHAVDFRTEEEIGDLENIEQTPAALRAEGAVIKGDVLLGNEFSADGEVVLSGARIQGSLTCSSGRFSATKLKEPDTDSGPEKTETGSNEIEDDEKRPLAFRADRIRVGGDVFLDDRFEASGEVRLRAAMIEGSLHCSNSKMTAGVTGCALDAQRMVVKGKFDLRGAKLSGLVKLAAAHVGTLADNNDSWIGSTLHLDGFQYDRIQGSEEDIKTRTDTETRTDAEARISWLEMQVPAHRKEDFRPQPWQQLIKVLREMGHPDEASKVAIKKEQLWGRSGQMTWIRCGLHRLHGLFASYGYRPMTTVWWLLGFWFIFSLLYYCGNQKDLFQPSAAAVQISLQNCRKEAKVPSSLVLCSVPPEYPRFDPFIYSADLILPFVDLQQESNWTPVLVVNENLGESRGWFVRAIVWAEIIVGWLMSLLLLTALGRVLNRD